MDIQDLKKMLKNSTAVLILENGEPSFVVVDYDSYRNLAGGKDQEVKVTNANGNKEQKPAGPNEVELLERINKDILALKAQIEDEEKMLGVD
ncbi:hypothetical protein KW791_02045 [Candidatus Parcubacteria bacterium]|nr:hypothetical protein [Candidatus Parcubacteria bacterium]